MTLWKNPPPYCSPTQDADFSGAAATPEIQFPPPFQANFYVASLYLKAVPLYLTTGRSYFSWSLKKSSLTILFRITQNTHTTRLGIPPSVSPQRVRTWLIKLCKILEAAYPTCNWYLLEIIYFCYTSLNYFPSTVYYNYLLSDLSPAELFFFNKFIYLFI